MSETLCGDGQESFSRCQRRSPPGESMDQGGRVSVMSPNPAPDVSRLADYGRGWPLPIYPTAGFRLILRYDLHRSHVPR